MKTTVNMISLIGNDDANRNQWCSKLACSRRELEAAIKAVGASAPRVRAHLVRRRAFAAGAGVVASALQRLSVSLGLLTPARH